MGRDHHLFLGSMGGVIVAIAVSIFSLLPYQSSVLYMDRRSGERIAYETDWYFVKREKATDVPDEIHERLSSYGDLTASQGLVELQRTKRRFPWLDHRVENGKGSKIGKIFYALFQDIGFLDPSKRPIPENEFKDLMKNRVMIWSSNFPETHGDTEYKNILKENNEMVLKLMRGE